MDLKLLLTTRATRVAAGVLVAAVAVLPLRAQEPREKAPKPPPDPAQIAKWKAEAEALPLFASKTPLEFTLTGNFKVITKDRDTLSTKDYWGELALASPGGAEAKFPVKLSTRGHFRLQGRNCTFVPLWVDFQKKELKGTVFDGQNRVKLVTHCRSNGEFDQYILNEYLAYQVHNILTPDSFRARLARVTYVDSASGKPLETRNAIFLEDNGDVARRMGGEIVETPNQLFATVDFQRINEVAIFEYFIGNTDWSLAALHNIKLVKLPNNHILPVAYDLDFSGLVDTKYAAPDSRLPIQNTRQRLYRGPCRTMDQLEPIFQHYRDKRSEIMALYDDFPGLNDRYVRDTKRWLGEFFDLLNKPRELKFTFVDNCKSQITV
jgi:hypothetical protein